MPSVPKILSILVKAFLAFLPWSVLFAVFFQHKIGIPGASFVKELLLLAIASGIAVWHFKQRKWPKFDVLDALVGAYVAWLLLSTLVNGSSFRHFVYGGRYDFEFLFALLAFKHVRPLLSEKLSEYVRIFLYSGTAAIVLGIFVRFVFGEEILLHFGFSPELSNWKFWGSVPIYHGIDQANVRRFQGIFDGPNPAAFFMIAYVGILWQFFRTRKDDTFLVGLWTLAVLFLIMYTYSRSSLVGIALGVSMALALSIRVIWKKYRKALALSIPLIALLFGAFYLRFENTIDRIILREGSSKGHFDRMLTGIERFRENPVFGEGLASSGPAYRYVTPSVKNENLYEGAVKKEEDYYIPESWYVQQLVEGGIPALALFLGILSVLALRLFAFSVPFFAAFVAACSMNLFLHTFESAYASLLLFAFAGLFFAKLPSRRERSEWFSSSPHA